MRPPEPADILLVVDVQTGLLEGPRAVPDAEAAVTRIGELLQSARDAGAPVIYLQNDGPPRAPDAVGSPGWEIHPALAPLPDELVLRKSGDDGFDGTTLERSLEQLGARRIAVAGLLSEMCVSATIRSAFACGFEVVLVRGAHATYDLDDIPAHVVSRVAEHALGDQLEIEAEPRFKKPSERRW
jgi:streptothricin hydrolase